jgi:hypothetical protein
MLIGHVAVGFAAKPWTPRTSLGTLVFAALLADVLWGVLLLAGVEHVQFRSGIGAANYAVATDIAWSHSLATGVCWAVLFALLTRQRDADGRAARMIALAVLSHWVLDAIAHRPDMPLAPGLSARIGFGLWTSVPATVLVEGGFWVLALVLFLRRSKPRRRLAHVVLWSAAMFLTLAWYNNIAGPPPPNPRTAPAASLAFFSLTIAWAYWVDRLYGPAIANRLQATRHRGIERN